MSRPLGAFFHIPHGLSNAMLLPDITEVLDIPPHPRHHRGAALPSQTR